MGKAAGFDGDGLNDLQVGGAMELTIGRGAPLVHRTKGPSSFKIRDQQMLSAAYAGATLTLQCAHRMEAVNISGTTHIVPGNASVCRPQADLKAEGAVGVLTWRCAAEPAGCVITATNGTTGGRSIFSVVKVL